MVELGEAERSQLKASWHEGCPVPIDDLRLLTLTHWGYDGQAHPGTIVVHRDAASDVLLVFQTLFRAGYPIERLAPIDVYAGNDDASMAANNSSGFNCREVTGRPGTWSEHAFGRAVDLNPVQNPFVREDSVLPEAGRRYVDRSIHEAPVIHADDAVVRAFRQIGWRWGGDWTSAKDYQHFSATGR